MVSNTHRRLGTVVSALLTGQVTALRNIHSSGAFFGDRTLPRRIV